MKPAALEIQNLVKRYASGQLALDGISFTVEQGDFYALLGPNGAGKSTTIGIICSLVNKTSGCVKILGKDIDKEFNQAKRMIGLVPQEFNFNNFDPVEEIVAHQAGYYGIDRITAREKTQYNLQRLGLWEKRKTTARELSGGMKRRLMIARALVHDPQLLILDEPTAGVDIEIRRSMWDLLQDLNASGKTIILTTHYLEEAETLCKNVGIINHGNIIINAPMRDLLDQLKKETFILYLANAMDMTPQLTQATTQLRDARTLEVTLNPEVSLNSIFEELAQKNIQVLSMRNKSNRLEELFIDIVKTQQ